MKKLLLACMASTAMAAGGYFLYDWHIASNYSRDFPRPDSACGTFPTISFSEPSIRFARSAIIYEQDPEYVRLHNLRDNINQRRSAREDRFKDTITKEDARDAILIGVIRAHLERKAEILEGFHSSGVYPIQVNREPDDTYASMGYYYDAKVAAEAYRAAVPQRRHSTIYWYGVPWEYPDELGDLIERSYDEEKTFIHRENLDEVIDFLSEAALSTLGECFILKNGCGKKILRKFVEEEVAFSAVEEIVDRLRYGFTKKQVMEEAGLGINALRQFVDYIPVVPYECACSPLSSYSQMERESLQSSLQARLDKLVEADRNDSPYPTSSSSTFPVVSLFSHNRFSSPSSDGFNYTPIVSRLCMNTAESSSETATAEPEPTRNICAEKESEGVSYQCVNRTDVSFIDGNEGIQLKNSLCMWFDVIDSNQGLARLSSHRIHWASGIAFKVADYLVHGNRESYEEYARIRDRRLSDFPHLFEVYDEVIDHCKCRVPFRRQHR